MAKDSELTVSQWLRLRQLVADKIRAAGSRQPEQTRITIAENLMAAGFIDVQAVKAEALIEDEPSTGDPADEWLGGPS